MNVSTGACTVLASLASFLRLQTGAGEDVWESMNPNPPELSAGVHGLVAGLSYPILVHPFSVDSDISRTGNVRAIGISGCFAGISRGQTETHSP